MMKYSYNIGLILLVLAFAGTGCQKTKTNDTWVTFQVSRAGNFYFQPEGEPEYEKVIPDSSGRCIFTTKLEESGYYQYTNTKQQFYSVYCVPGARMEICEDSSGVTFRGDLAAENTFLAENRFTAVVPEEIPAYSEEWIKINTAEQNRLLES